MQLHPPPSSFSTIPLIQSESITITLNLSKSITFLLLLLHRTHPWPRIFYETSVFSCLQSSVIHELEARVSQLSEDADNLTRIRAELERDKAALTDKCDKLEGEVMDYRARWV